MIFILVYFIHLLLLGHWHNQRLKNRTWMNLESWGITCADDRTETPHSFEWVKRRISVPYDWTLKTVVTSDRSVNSHRSVWVGHCFKTSGIENNMKKLYSTLFIRVTTFEYLLRVILICPKWYTRLGPSNVSYDMCKSYGNNGASALHLSIALLLSCWRMANQWLIFMLHWKPYCNHNLKSIHLLCAFLFILLVFILIKKNNVCS